MTSVDQSTAYAFAVDTSRPDTAPILQGLTPMDALRTLVALASATSYIEQVTDNWLHSHSSFRFCWCEAALSGYHELVLHVGTSVGEMTAAREGRDIDLDIKEVLRMYQQGNLDGIRQYVQCTLALSEIK